MKFIKIILVLLVFICNIGIYSVRAQSPTSTDSGSLRDSVKQKVNEELSQIKNAVAKRAFVGSITAKADATITITSPSQSQSRSAIVSPDTTIKLVSGKDGTTTDLIVGNFVIAMGEVNSQNVMTVKRILVIPTPKADTRQVIHGTVTAVSTTSLTVQAADQTTSTLKLTSATKYTGKTKVTDVKVNSHIVVIVNKTSTTLTALRIHLFAK